MERYQTLAALVALCFVTCEGGLIRREDISTNETYASEDFSVNFECINTKHINCLVPNLDQYQSTLGNESVQVRVAFASSRSNLEDVAESLLATKTCLQNETNQSYCQNVSTEQDIDGEVTFVADFLASSERIDLVVNATSSKCLSSHDRLRVATGKGYNCLTDLYSSLQDPDVDPCDALDSMRTCVTNVTSQWCGAEAGALVAAIWDYTVQSDFARGIIRQLGLPAYAINMCYNHQQYGIVKRFTRAVLKGMKN